MNQSPTLRTSRSGIVWNKILTFLSKPHNVILLLMGIVVTVTTIAPVVAIVEDTFKIHPGTIDAHLTGQVSGYTLVNYIDLFTSNLAKTNLWSPLLNTLYLRRCVRLFGHPHQFGLAEVPQLYFHLPLHHAPVDAGRGVAEPL